ncbi:MAG: trehalose 6-phosphate synthase [Pseudodesulfovibrio sp.]
MAEAIQRRKLETLKDFYGLMARTRAVRFSAVADALDGRPAAPETLRSLRNALACLEDVPVFGERRVLALDDSRSIELDMDYEMGETRKDLFYLEEGESAFLDFLADLHPGFDGFLAAGRELLAGLDLGCLVTDRDGTVNNYCARYLTSIQSVYNAVFLTRFARRRVRRPVVLTSAPLDGLVRISVAPEGVFYYAASKGRECLDREGRVRRLPIEPDKQRALDGLNGRLAELVARPGYEKFALIGSGLQFKFGQSTVARQDIGGSVPEAESLAFLKVLEGIVAEADPAGRLLRIEDTGLDVEIILTVESEGGGARDFDKGDGVRFLNTELDLGMFRGAHLVCGDTGSDVPMLEAAMEMAPKTRAIFVTRKEELARRVTGITDNALIVPEPDMLVAVMGTL